MAKTSHPVGATDSRALDGDSRYTTANANVASSFRLHFGR